MNPLTMLPEDLVSDMILSLTSPRNASRFAVISKGFKSAAESDTVWDKFLPYDCSHIILRSVSPVVYATKKQLYFSLCHSPILLDARNLSFWLEKESGKKCFMVAARALGITWGRSRQYWEWISCADSRFSEVAQLESVCWLDIRGQIKTHMLSSNTSYGAYLVFKLTERCYGLESADAFVRLNDEAAGDAERRACTVHLQPVNSLYGYRQQTGPLPVRRSDGWMEIEMGDFYNNQGDNDGEAEARLMQIRRLHWKTGLVVEGVEFRPKEQFAS